jgi:tungstate transport system ATP-binding protein
MENTVFCYGDQDQAALNINQLNFSLGTVNALTGSNGAGKTTLLKILNGLLSVNSGAIYYKDQLIDQKNRWILTRASVYVHQNPLLLSGTVFDNIIYGLKIRKFTKPKIDDIGEKFLKMLDLKKLAYRKAKNLSYGEIKRVAIARALAVAPEVLLLDEPTAHADQKSSLKIQETLLEIKQELGLTIIFSSHDVKLNEQLADNIFLLEHGNIKN